ncbi:MAG: NAD(P)/FAD-dependent oxidoreductase [Lunatimonas sp.]|uniref:NAD(P)/FAD-dependent oxidoreductase n=1 Tax=Lunatimonas sp. TaxID=2060141 RepID=UPI00263B759C|nr:NAD(P)/FAD-dependent oxidoreductase [Lunatimonas sp.]MCC5936647.1 NAD(P)/FAD-dependent oxidoreductase [Lunatimonas sp.]
MRRIGVIGGGAAGFFAAIHASASGNRVTIFEKSTKLLSKVKVSGGGRCNVTNECREISKLVRFYPRGEKFLRKVFCKFSVSDTISWFELRGVPLKTEPDGRIFPVSDSSQSVIDTLMLEAQRFGVVVKTKTGIEEIRPHGEGFFLISGSGQDYVDRVIITSGGHAKAAAYDFIKSLGHSIVDPVPSLFTFNTPRDPVRSLMGISMPCVHIRLEGTKLAYEGPLLITHWGVSGPAVLKLSAYGAKWLHDQVYKAKAHIRWDAGFEEDTLRSDLQSYRERHPKRRVGAHSLFQIPARLWLFLTQKAEIDPDQHWYQISNKQINKLLENLFRFTIEIDGKTTFKEEFVTAGGVSLEEISPGTMQSKLVPGVFFAGEVIDIDGITGGFNFQAAWSTGFVAGTSVNQ